MVERRPGEDEDAIKVALVGKYRAEVDADTAAAVSELAASVKDVSQVSLRMGSLLLVKYQDRGGTVLHVHHLSREEADALERFPEILTVPREVLSRLDAVAPGQSEDRPSILE